MMDSSNSPSQDSGSKSLEDVLNNLEQKFSGPDMSNDQTPDSTPSPNINFSRVSKKKILTGLTLLLVVSGSVAGFYLTQSEQELRQQAQVNTVEIVPAQTFTPEVVETQTEPISIKLIDATTSQELSALSNGSTVQLNDSPKNIEATFSNQNIKSVIMKLTGPQTETRTLNLVPYLLSDTSLSLSPGSYTLEVTSYAQTNGLGLPMDQQTIQFAISE